MEERGRRGSDCCSNFAVKCKLTSPYRDIKQTLFHFVRIAHFIAHSINICFPLLLLLLMFMSLICIKYLFSSFHSIFYGKHAACFMCALAKDLWPFDAKLPATCSSMLTLLPVPLVPHCVYLTWPLLGRSSSVCFAYCLYFSAVLFMQTATCTRLLRCPLSIVRSPLPFAFVDIYIAYQIYFTVTIFNLLFVFRFGPDANLHAPCFAVNLFRLEYLNNCLQIALCRLRLNCFLLTSPHSLPRPFYILMLPCGSCVFMILLLCK